jgi:DNA-binding HxlR family transcriptional regulator
MSHNSNFCSDFHKAVELIGRRWSGAIVWEMLGGTCRFTELRDAIPDISDRMLCARLRELESEGVVARQVSGETPVRVEYHLTDKGLALKGVVAAIGDWADRWSECPESGPDRHPERSEGSAGSCK